MSDPNLPYPDLVEDDEGWASWANQQARNRRDVRDNLVLGEVMRKILTEPRWMYVSTDTGQLVVDGHVQITEQEATLIDAILEARS